MSEEAGGQPQEPRTEIEDEIRLIFRAGDYAGAVERIREHLARSPDDVAALDLLATALRYTGDKAGAAGALVTASELYGQRGMVVQSIAAQKKAMKLGVDPDFSIARPVPAAPGRLPTPLFDDLSDDELQVLAAGLEGREYREGETVVEEGAPGDSMFVVVGGTVEVLTKKRDADVVLAVLGPGDFFGEAALLSGRPRTATIRAKTPAECLELSRAALDEVVARHPRVREVMAEFNEKRAESTIETLLGRRRG